MDDKVRTQGYLTLEVLYASRRLDAYGDHITMMLKQLLENAEVAMGMDTTVTSIAYAD